MWVPFYFIFFKINGVNFNESTIEIESSTTKLLLLLCYGISLGKKSLPPNGNGSSPLSSSACS